MDKEDELHNKVIKEYKNPLEEHLNYKTYNRLMRVCFAILVILGMLQTYQQFKNKRERVLRFL
ncbi:unnamed protein product (macronuclear) [Paramecium tetraurelia]|uniref:Uncharacterized protein n=1 Tax=Paramecium tetraurelia TaxID=5888 RepID=A0DCE7_PARTE|nr:uncharacterized protein GSPATT00015592001 [Paramecium tetraurelia]CAK80714.1 unnamed protein product [Paramecium tetraurelia]|eukprot:XP_001448111.1 hypothetical protein (macronuclear) [Paramecium tetraurelia strain d4-2]